MSRFLAEPKHFNPNFDSEKGSGRDQDPELKRLQKEAMEPIEAADRDELVRENNFFKYDNVIQPYEPLAQPFSYFYLTVAGQIEFGEFVDLDGLQLKYNFVSGDDWQVASGNTEASSQFAFKNSTNGAQKRLVWNLGFEVQFRSLNPAGWPQLVIQCLERTSSGKEFVKAYGSTHVPVEPGMHKKSIRTFSPIQTGSFWEYFGYQQIGSLPTKLVSPEAIAHPEGRELSRVVASGKVSVTMQVTQRNLGRHRYVVSSK